jgi:hypothetical protein
MLTNRVCFQKSTNRKSTVNRLNVLNKIKKFNARRKFRAIVYTVISINRMKRIAHFTSRIQQELKKEETVEAPEVVPVAGLGVSPRDGLSIAAAESVRIPSMTSASLLHSIFFFFPFFFFFRFSLQCRIVFLMLTLGFVFIACVLLQNAVSGSARLFLNTNRALISQSRKIVVENGKCVLDKLPKHINTSTFYVRSVDDPAFAVKEVRVNGQEGKATLKVQTTVREHSVQLFFGS